MGEEETCNTTLGLGIGVGITRERQLKKNKKAFWLDLSLPLHPKIEANDQGDHDLDFDDEKDQDSFSSKTIDDQEEERGMKRNDCSNVDIYNNNNGGSRKKLKLTTEQITLLEDSFKIHSTLNTGQKQELAKKLDLLPRQIEVWFQNRRARTKLKQIEQECELLKKCCETLSDENGRLKKELQEVRCRCSSKFDHHHHPPPLPLYIQCPTMAAMCHPYDKFGKSGEETKTAAAVNGGAVVQMHDDSNKKNATATIL